MAAASDQHTCWLQSLMLLKGLLTLARQLDLTAHQHFVADSSLCIRVKLCLWEERAKIRLT